MTKDILLKFVKDSKDENMGLIDEGRIDPDA